MQTSSREILFDQVQQATLAAPAVSTLNSGDNDSTISSSLNAPAALNTILRELMPDASLDHIVRSLATLTRQTLGMDLCVVMLADTELGQLTIQAASPDLNGRLLTIVPLSVAPGLWEKLCAASSQLPQLNAGEQEALNPLKNVQYEKLHIVPLSVASTCVGLLYCYSGKARDLDMQEQLILLTIGSFAAMSITNRQLLDASASTVSVKSFFDDLLVDNIALADSVRGRAVALGCDCAQPHIMLELEIARVFDTGEQAETSASKQVICRHALKLVEQRLLVRYPGSLCDEREQRLYAIIAPGAETLAKDLKTWLDALLQQVESELQVSLFVGISNTCHALCDYQDGFMGAKEALTIAECLHTRAASMQFSDLGAYRYIYAFARDLTRNDLYLEQVATIARYDQGHKRAELLDTLEVFLAHLGNIKEASDILDVHRNTLTQRLERIQSLCSINLEQYSNWLPLQVAILVHRLRAQSFARR